MERIILEKIECESNGTFWKAKDGGISATGDTKEAALGNLILSDLPMYEFEITYKIGDTTTIVNKFK